MWLPKEVYGEGERPIKGTKKKGIRGAKEPWNKNVIKTVTRKIQ